MHTNTSRSLLLGSLAALLLSGSLPAALLAQSQDNSAPSVAEAARKAKEQKKNASKPGRVITEDTLSLRPASADSAVAPTAISTPAPAAAAASSAGEASSDTAAEAPRLPKGVSADMVSTPPSNKRPTTPAVQTAKPAPAVSAPAPAAVDEKEAAAEKASQASEAAHAKELLAQMQGDLEFLKRQLSVDKDSFYTKPDYVRDADGKAKLDQLEKLVNDKQLSLEEFKKQIANLLQMESGAEAPVNPPKP